MSEWISIKDWPPKFGMLVLVAYEYGLKNNIGIGYLENMDDIEEISVVNNKQITNYKRNKPVWFDTSCCRNEIENVTHWMSLPNQPENK